MGKAISWPLLTSLSQHLQVKSKLTQEAEKDGGGRLKAIIDTVIGNLQTSITNVHIRYEVSITHPHLISSVMWLMVVDGTLRFAEINTVLNSGLQSN